MHKFISIFSLTFLLVFVNESIPLFSQNSDRVDSLKNLLNLSAIDSIRASAAYHLVFEFFNTSLDSAKPYVEICHRAGRQSKVPKYMAVAWSVKGTYYLYSNEYDSSAYYFNKAIEVTNEFDLPMQASALYTNLGVLYKRQRMYDKAIEQYLDGIIVDTKNEHYNGMAIKQLNVANLYASISKLEKAIEYNEYALENLDKFESARKPMIHGLILNNLGTNYIELNDFNKALFYFNASLEINEKNKIDNEISRNVQNIGATLEKLDRAEESLAYLNRALKIRRKVGDEIGLIETHMQLGSSYGKLGNDQGELHFDSAFQLATSIEDFELMAEVKLAEANQYEFSKQYQKAYQVLKENNIYKDSLTSQYDQKAIFDLEVKYNSAQKDLQLTKQEFALAKRTAQRNLFLALSSIGLILLWFLIYRNRKNRILNKERIATMETHRKIAVMDAMLLGQEEERKRIAQDLHDGLGALLVSAQLQVQKVQAELKKISESDLAQQAQTMIDSAFGEVRRISHNMMPLALVDLGLVAALEDLIDLLNNKGVVQMELDAYPHSLNIDQRIAVQVYRIIQEILQNIVKHAHANHAYISLKVLDENILLNVVDDGIGFRKKEAVKGLGLNSIKSRVKYLNGQLAVTTQPGEGCRYDITIPLKHVNTKDVSSEVLEAS